MALTESTEASSAKWRTDGSNCSFKKVADEADRFAPQSHFIPRRAAYVFYSPA